MHGYALAEAQSQMRWKRQESTPLAGNFPDKASEDNSVHHLRQLRKTASVAERQRIVDEVCGSAENGIVRNAALGGCDLTQLNLTRLRFEGVDLRGAACANAAFGEMVDCNLNGIDATAADLPLLVRCTAREAVLAKARLGGRMRDCDFSGADLTSARIGAVLSNHFSECGNNCFDRARLSDLDAAGGYFSNCNFGHARLDGARLSRAAMHDCEFEGALFHDANLLRATFARCRFAGTAVANCIIDSESSAMLPQVFQVQGAVRTMRLPSPGRQVELLQMALEAWKCKWQASLHRGDRTETIIITNRLSSGDVRGYAFESTARDFIRMYPMEGDAHLADVLRDIGTDYVQWRIDHDDAVLETDEDRAPSEVMGLFRRALDEMWPIGV